MTEITYREATAIYNLMRSASAWLKTHPKYEDINVSTLQSLVKGLDEESRKLMRRAVENRDDDPMPIVLL